MLKGWTIETNRGDYDAENGIQTEQWQEIAGPFGTYADVQSWRKRNTWLQTPVRVQYRTMTVAEQARY